MNLFMTEFPEMDELSVSHLSRISQANGINSFESFCGQFIFEKSTSLFHAYNSKYSGSNTGLNFPVYNIAKYLPESDPIVTDPEDYLLKHTLFPVYAPLIQKLRRNNISITMFRGMVALKNSSSQKAMNAHFISVQNAWLKTRINADSFMPTAAIRCWVYMFVPYITVTWFISTQKKTRKCTAT